MQHRVSLYEDGIVLFLHPTSSEIEITLDILHLFGEASDLRTNVQKSNVYHYSVLGVDTLIVQEKLPYEVLNFPYRYLSIAQSLRKLTCAQIQPIIIDRIANLFLGWKADILTHLFFLKELEGPKPLQRKAYIKTRTKYRSKSQQGLNLGDKKKK